MWLVYAALAYLVFPLLTAWAAVPQLPEVYSEAGWSTITRVVLFGFGWGLSVVMLGLAVAAVGLAVSTGIILGSSLALGSLIPLLLLGAEQVFSAEGARIAVADLIVLSGVMCCARAGYLRDQRPADAHGGDRIERPGSVALFCGGSLDAAVELSACRRNADHRAGD